MPKEWKIYFKNNSNYFISERTLIENREDNNDFGYKTGNEWVNYESSDRYGRAIQSALKDFKFNLNNLTYNKNFIMDSSLIETLKISSDIIISQESVRRILNKHNYYSEYCYNCSGCCDFHEPCNALFKKKTSNSELS